MPRYNRVNKNVVVIIALSLASIIMILALGYYEIQVLGNYDDVLKQLNLLDDKQHVLDEIQRDSRYVLEKLMEKEAFNVEETVEIESKNLAISLNLITLSNAHRTKDEREPFEALEASIREIDSFLAPMLLRNKHESLGTDRYHTALNQILESIYDYETILSSQIDDLHNQLASYFPIAHENITFSTFGISILMLILTVVAMFFTRKYNLKVYEMAYHDKESNLFTRQYFNEIVDDVISKTTAMRAYVMIDIATINELDGILGAKVGNQLIAEIGDRFVQKDMGIEVAGRLGGCVFTMLTKPFSTLEALNEDLDRIYAQLKNPFLINGYTIRIDFNFGVSLFPKDHVKAAELEQMAGNVLYLSKKLGLNRIEYYDNTIKEVLASNLEMSFRLSSALKAGDFFVVYQPIVSRFDSQVSIYEALIRWSDNGTIIPPMSFIPLAERNGQIIKIGLFVIEQVCLMLSKYPKHVAVSINISPVQLQNQSFYNDVVECIGRYNINASQLIFEITENLFVSNFEEANALLEKFRAIGIQIALDDFGTGYSSLGYLKSMAVDILKIDKMFVSSLDDDSHTIVGEIVKIAHKMDLKVVAEGIETNAHYETLRELNVDFFQGYYLGRPDKLEF